MTGAPDGESCEQVRTRCERVVVRVGRSLDQGCPRTLEGCSRSIPLHCRSWEAIVVTG